MASSSSVSNSIRHSAAHKPFWLWPNLLSLDAPLIAALWQDVFARDSGVNLSMASRLCLPLAVWLIYLSDRLLDTQGGVTVYATARHTFYCEQRRMCRWLAGSVAAVLFVSIWFLPVPVIVSGLTVAGAVAAYLLIVHWMGGKLRRWFPKEAAVGFIFGVGTALAPWTRATDPARLLFPALLFGILCWANSSAIEVWEGGGVDRVSAWAVAHMKNLAVLTCLLCVPMALEHFSQHTAIALCLSAMGYWAVADAQGSMSADALRVAIDVPLLTPLLLLGMQ